MNKKRNFWLILIIIILIVGGFAYLKFRNKDTINNSLNNSNKDGTNDKVYGNCPEELNKEIINVMSGDFVTPFPKNLRIYEEDYVQGKGSFDGYCRVGSKSGENVNWVYCDSSGFSFIYTQKERVDDKGFIHGGEKWDIKIIFDHTTCQKYRQEDLGKMILPLYKCNIIEVRCN